MILYSEYRLIIALVLVPILLLASYLMQHLMVSHVARQNKIIASGPAEPHTSNLRLMLGQFAFASVIVGSSAYVGGIYFEFFGIGYLISMLVEIMLSIQANFYYKGLAAESSAEGQIKFSNRFGCQNLAYRLFGAGFLMLSLYLLFGELAYLGAVLFTCSTAAGYLRRANI